MAINDPEIFRRLIAWQEEEKARLNKEMTEAGGTVIKGAKAVAKLIAKK